MSDIPIKLTPGISLVKSPMLNEGGWSAANLIRFYAGLLQKRGGWTALSQNKVAGTCRGIHAFNDLTSLSYVVAGSDQLLQLFMPTTPNAPLSSIVTPPMLLPDITPVAQTSNLVSPFSTQTGSSVVSVQDPTSPAVVGDWIYIAPLTFVGGIALQGLYQVASLIAGGFTFNAGTPALSDASGAGALLNFTSTAGSAIIGVALQGYAFVGGESLLVYVPTVVGGINLAGLQTVALVGGNAQIQGAGPASGSANVTENGGAVQILYLEASAAAAASTGAFGTGAFGAGAFGVGPSVTPAPFVFREYTIDNFGQIAAAAPKNGRILSWTPPFAYNNRAAPVGNDAPQFSTGIFVAMPEEQLVSFGSDGGGFQDPLLVRWSNVGDFRSNGAWTATATNQAGSFRLSRGSAIIGGMQSSFGNLLWTDVGLWLMQYIQPPFIYGFSEIGKGCGLIAMRAAAQVGGRVIWPAQNSFWQFGGQDVEPLECDVWDYFYENVDPQFLGSITAFPNSDFTEIAWHFAPLGANGVPTNYVSLNLSMLASGTPAAQCWDYGTLTRTAATDRSAGGIFSPLAVDGAGLIQAHETQTDANGAPMPSFAETAWFRVAAGREYMFVERLFPDFVFGPGGGTVNVTIFVGEYPEDVNLGLIRTFGPFACTPKTQHVIPRCRGRLMKLHFDFSTVGTFARLGQPIARMAPAGGR